MSGQPISNTQQNKGELLEGDSKSKDVRMSNILAAKAVADAVRTSLGPRGMDKMIQAEKGEVLITNDGATILGQIQVLHPAARMLVELSKAQDIEAGDGTTTVVVIAGALLDACTKLLNKGIHSTVIADCFLRCAEKAQEILSSMAIPVSLEDRESLLRAASTSLSSKVVSNNSAVLAPIAVDAVLQVSDVARKQVDLRNIKIVKQLGGTIDDSQLIRGLVFPRASDTSMLGVRSVKNAKIGLIQFHLSAPKTDIDNKVIINDYTQMDRLLREERAYILNMCKKIKQAGCNVLLVQKSILRDAVNELSLHFLSKLKILVLSNIERDDIDFIARTLHCRPIAHIDSFTPDKLGHADLVEEVELDGRRITQITGVPASDTVSVLLRGSNNLVLDESDRSLHDALCVVRCLVKKPFLLVGGGAPESEVFVEFQKWAGFLEGADRIIARAFAEALEVVPYTLAENAGMHAIQQVTELRQRHAMGEKTAGIDVKRGCIGDMKEEGVIQPLLVTASAIQQATEYVHMMLKIDDMVATLK
ncbi:uncharacterized protein [Blastocystis hominis]|uniref:T-complex protein 1 subunit delta n=1 Tax=Blastocystis hominis TaxID=12968 RepID=D8M6E9_BLAHO|nr:uncharacterized protein [Blastocystis hominis]CBK23702.2 unnamed protein product [Blastocystis hominis]|eukprot:XP_012897750.1 uncharacterized protein [Blastocystis hominis]